MFKEMDKLKDFYEIFKSNLLKHKIEISEPIFHDYHFISEIKTKELKDFESLKIKIYYKPSSNSYRLLITKNTDYDSIIIQIFNHTQNQINLLDFSNVSNEKINNIKSEDDDILDKNMLRIYVDGSYNEKTKKAGWAFCVVKEFEVIHKDFGVYDENEDKTKQVIAEIYALYKSLIWLNENNIIQASIYYDYKGIEKWINGDWKVKSKNIEDIIHKIKKLILEKNLNLKFIKIEAHRGDYFNELVDKLAKKASNI